MNFSLECRACVPPWHKSINAACFFSPRSYFAKSSHPQWQLKPITACQERERHIPLASVGLHTPLFFFGGGGQNYTYTYTTELFWNLFLGVINNLEIVLGCN